MIGREAMQTRTIQYSDTLMLSVDVTYARWNVDADRHRNRGENGREISSGMAIVHQVLQKKRMEASAGERLQVVDRHSKTVYHVAGEQQQCEIDTTD